MEKRVWTRRSSTETNRPHKNSLISWLMLSHYTQVSQGIVSHLYSCLRIYLIINSLLVAMFFAFLVLFVCKLLIINMLVVEAAGVGRTPDPQSTQIIDSAKCKSVMIVIIFRSWHNPVTKWVQLGPCSLLSTFPHFPIRFHHSSTLKCSGTLYT